MNVIELKKKKASLVEEARKLLDGAEAEKRELTAEEKQEYEKRIAEIRTLAEKIEREEELQRHELLTAKKVEQVEREAHYGEFRSLGEFIATIRFNRNDPRLVMRSSEDPVAKVGDGEQGGYLVPDRFLDEILQVKPEEAVVRPRAQIIPAGDPPDATMYVPVLDQAGTNMYGGVEVQWIEEGAAKPPSKPIFDRISLTPHEVAGTISVTDKLLRNTAAWDPLARRLLRNAVIAAEDAAFLTGGGTTEPTGIIGHASNIQVPRETAGAVGYEDIINMYASQLMGGTYVWIANQTVLPQLMAMEDGAGHLVWQPNAREGAPGTLVGIPCLISGRLPVLGNTGDLVLADLKYYLIKDGSGIFIDASPHIRFTENITVVKVTWNVDGRPWPSSPFTLEDGSTQVSPFVVLAASTS